MEELDVRERAEALCAALVTGDVTQVTADFSEELQHNLGEVLALLVLPSTEATIDSIEGGFGSGYVVRLRLVGDSEEVMIQTRWKDRDGKPTVIEASHLSRTERAPDEIDLDADTEASEAVT
ncbi:MAG: hypothetical protein ABIZ34_10015 [Candidatus Limnocylindrales bacterium]